jgi:vacuolar-type H+-ATPase subunit I/STV1
MKKKKLKIREKIKNKPKARTHSKKKSNINRSQTENEYPTAVDSEEQGTEVMSKVIWDFAGPLLETCNDLSSEKKAISLAIFVWNASLLSEQERIQTLDRYLEDCRNVMPPEEIETLSSYIDQLVRDKEDRFSTIRKKITNCTFGDFNDNRHIEVGYTIE